ncbi:DGQHR domain-containing protein [Vibrio cholerae]|uniref:DGQHR domain-containing protein n=1 Tax=Vibrio cholerae TaxID=666 RepID=UPI0006815FD0|nr:DGQHR domain-containing protein [Vibrio cholerae]HAU9839259.1 DGQHR domain-containing protein [Vibrio cholerae O1]
MSLYTPIHSNVLTPLELVLFKGNEGLSKKNVRIFEGIVTARELVDHFNIERDSTVYSEYQKRQRDLEKSRSNKLIQYFEEREDTSLPSIVIFISHLVDEEETKVRNRDMVLAKLPSDADRLIADGQNRRNLYENILKSQSWRANETLNVKFICVDSPDKSLENYGFIIRQLFSDFHFNLKKPSTALNLYFDSSQPYRKLLDKFLSIEVHGFPLKRFISTTGKLTPHSVMLLNQLLEFISVCIGKSSSSINKLLKTKPEVADMIFQRYSAVVQSFFNLCPLYLLGTEGFRKDDTMFEKFIFAKAFAWTARSLVEQIIDEFLFEHGGVNGDNTESISLDFSPLKAIEKLPLLDMTNEFWVQAGAVVKSVDQNTEEPKFKMNRGSEKLLARALCRRCKIQPSSEL